jgi:hypothetical protein
MKDPQIYISKEARELYDNARMRFSEIKNLDNKDFFMLAVIFGFSKGTAFRKPLLNQDRTKSGFTRERYLTDLDNAILKAIGIAEKSELELGSGIRISDVYSLAEEYANSGIDEIKSLLFEQDGSFLLKFSNFLLEHYKDESEKRPITNI